jgi:hypothetical protein
MRVRGYVFGIGAALAALVGGVSLAAPASAALRVAAVRSDSAVVVATWGRGCDVRGCPTSYQVIWTGGQRSLMRVVVPPTDTFTVPLPAWGDSLRVTVSVRSIRRTLQGPTTTMDLWLKRPDAPPPAVDSLQLHPDTVAVLAWRDSFPSSEWETRPATGWQYALEGGDSLPLPSWSGGPTVSEGYYTVFCQFAVNRYTKARVLLMAPDALNEDVAACRVLEEKLAAARDA